MRIEIDNKSWYDITDFDSYEEIEGLGEVTGTIGVPDCVDIDSDWDSIQEYLKLSDDEQAIMIAYAEANSVFDWSEAQDAYMGEYLNDAVFAEEICKTLEWESMQGVPDYLANCIDWQMVWNYYLRFDYFEQDGLYFRNL